MTDDTPEDPAAATRAGDSEPILARLVAKTYELADEFGLDGISTDLKFLAFLRLVAPFGIFSLGPLSIRVAMVEERFLELSRGEGATPAVIDDEFFLRLAERRVRTGRRRVDELDVLLAFMNMTQGLPAAVFGELGVSPDRVEAFVSGTGDDAELLEPLRSPEQAAEYLGVHVETVRSWIRSGRLKATRLAGQRALRIRASDLVGLLEPLESSDD